jgi:hypothetical protein
MNWQKSHTILYTFLICGSMEPEVIHAEFLMATAPTGPLGGGGAGVDDV